ncbi:MAG: outer membrane protein transport protein [Paludibacter sp.]|nr:outer membrane protein transport protein [Paludibacter sp.]
MKKIIIALTVILNCLLIEAQTEFDALKLSQTDITGTARYMGMAGAFGALGGDASAIKDNPAGLGIYRSSELTGTLNVMMQKGNSTWNGVKSMDDMYKIGFNNFSYVLATPTWRKENGSSGLLSSNFSFGYNRLANFNRTLNIKSGSAASSMTDYMAYLTDNFTTNDLTYTSNYEPFDNVRIPWLSVLAFEGKLMNETVIDGVSKWKSALGNSGSVTPSYLVNEKGYVDQYSLGWAGNFNNSFFLGTTLNFRSLNYTSISSYSELFSENRGMMNLRDSIYSSGTGFNLNVGAIYSITDNIRLGLSVHTPTVYSISDNYYSKLFYEDYTNKTNGYTGTPGGTNSFQLQGPMQLNLSAAYIVGTKGLVSVEYDYDNNTAIRLKDANGSSQSYIDENQGMSQMLRNVNTIKIGGEYRLTDNFAFRAGFAHSSNATAPNAAKLVQSYTIRTDTEFYRNNSTNYLSAGFGYREANWFIDCAYMNKMLDESFYPYNSNKLDIAVNPAKVSSNTNNIVVTLGLKF